MGAHRNSASRKLLLHSAGIAVCTLGGTPPERNKMRLTGNSHSRREPSLLRNVSYSLHLLTGFAGVI